MTACSWKEYFTIPCDFRNNFWQSLEVWILKPHVLNKKIGAVDIFEIGKNDAKSLWECLNYFKKGLQTVNNLTFKNDLNILIENYLKLKEIEKFEGGSETCLRIVYPKTGGSFIENIDIITKDYVSNKITFIKAVEVSSNISPVTIPYSITHEGDCLKLFVPDGAIESAPLNWLGTTLLPKLVAWMKPQLTKTPKYSNKLISACEYITIYNEIKEKYFKSIEEIWTESTNPKKFIIEDIAIASYLLVLWGEKRQRFVDLGCGNGLLVHILNSENHLGVGLDVRARKIWKLYPETTVLKESTITPSLDCRFDNVDWIIGNHSDELTPWIPVIAAKSDYKVNFFLLPCCLFEFNGNKYARNCSNQSCYEEYMEYVENICQACGFTVERDRLKIPSTKRNCFVSMGRVYSENEKCKYDKKVNDFVNCKMNDNDQIKVRTFKEKVQNCTQLNKIFISDVVTKVAKHIISKSKNYNGWKEGEFTDLKDLVELVSPDDRKQLKNECGGLQTLLKNHRHIFLVTNGRVKLRKPTERVISPENWKKRECWFFNYHPESCPLSNQQCSYIHQTEMIT